MRRKELLEVNLTDELSDVIDLVTGEALWGGTMQRSLERIDREFGRQEMFLAASIFAEEKNLDYIIIRLDSRLFLVSAERDNDLLPIFRASPERADDDVYLDAIEAQAQAVMLPPYLEDFWIDTYTDQEDLSSREQAELNAAQSQRSIRRGVTEPDDSEDPGIEVDVPPAAETPPATPGSSSEERAPPAAADGTGPLARFASSGQGGIANNPEEEDAIRELQTFLVDLGLDVGRNGVDGRYGPRTTQAVRDFQTAASEHLGYDLLSSDGDPDGDAGPITIPAIIDVRNDIQEIDRLVTELRSENMADSIIPVHLKSGLSKLFEQLLFEDDRADLQTLIDRYRPFVEQFPNATVNRSPGGGRPSIFNQAVQILSGEAPATTEPATTEPAAESGLNWEEIDLAPEDIQNERGVPTNTVVLDQGLGATMLFVPIDSINGREFDYIDGDTTGTSVSVTGPEGLVFAINQEIERRNAESEVQEPEEEPEVPQQQTATYGNDFTDNVETYLTQTDRQLQATETFLSTIQLEGRSESELRTIRNILGNLVIPLHQGRRMLDVAGQTVGTDGGARPDSAEAIRSYVQGPLDNALQQSSSEPAATSEIGDIPQNARRKARELFDMIDGVTLPSTNNRITEVFLSIQNSQEYEQINNAYRVLSDGINLLDAAENEMFLNMTSIRRHLARIGVAEAQTETQEIRNILKLLRD